ncbi:phage tail protein [uncultured Campylobacter sp.]|uniref:phage tail protein n=1 Tax=uncultured Campylobacter sp. TaxID=218934 RepID=UPI002628C79B|nr:phage tail protein [uncultured Campylobacter sp.]
MANVKEDKIWEEGIYQLEVTDPVVGGIDGISNKQAKQLANRTSYLKEQLENDKNSVDTALAKKRDVEDSYSKTEVDEKLTAIGTTIGEKLGKSETAADSAKLGGLAADKYALKSEASDGLKIGSYLLWSSNRTTPAGFLPADGRRLQKSEYIELFDVIGYTYGGSGEHFNLPKFNDGKFIRGTGGNAASLGIAQDDAIRNITGVMGTILSQGGHDGKLIFQTAAGSMVDEGTRRVHFCSTYTLNFDASRAVPVASENRPYNMSVIILIKVKNVFEVTNVDKSPYATEVKAGIVKLKNSITGSLSDAAVSEKAAKEYADKNASIGIGQTLQNLKSKRRNGEIYTNTTGRPIFIFVSQQQSSSSQTCELEINGEKVIRNITYSNADGCIIVAPIPAGATYKIIYKNYPPLEWWELR